MHDGTSSAGRGGAEAPPRLTAAALSLRPIRPEDEEFLCSVYASTRTEELARVDWSEEEKAAFLGSQFAAQHRYYQENYPSSTFEVVLLGGQPAGRLYVARWPEELRIIDVALLPAFRGRGAGTALIVALQKEAVATGLPLRIHVERHNPALGLYTRLGFKEIADRGVYLFLEWRDASGRHVEGTRAKGLDEERR